MTPEERAQDGIASYELALEAMRHKHRYSHPTFTETDAQAAAVLYATGESTHAIATQTGTSQSRVKRMLLSVGVTLRSKNSPRNRRNSAGNVTEGRIGAIITEAAIAALYWGREYE